MDIKKIQIYLISIIIINILFLGFNIYSFQRISSGQAYYITESGFPGIRDPAAPLPEEMASINIWFWTIFLVISLMVLITIRGWAKHEIKVDKKKKAKRKIKK